MKELTKELIGLMKEADKVRDVHKKVAKKKIFSYEYLRLIRTDEKDFKDKPENYKKVQRLINAYKKVLQTETKKLWDYSSQLS